MFTELNFAPANANTRCYAPSAPPRDAPLEAVQPSLPEGPLEMPVVLLTASTCMAGAGGNVPGDVPGELAW